MKGLTDHEKTSAYLCVAGIEVVEVNPGVWAYCLSKFSEELKRESAQPQLELFPTVAGEAADEPTGQ